MFIRHPFVYTEYERSLLFILSNHDMVPKELLVLIVEYVGTKNEEKKLTPIDHLHQDQKTWLKEKIFLLDYCTLLTAPPGTGKTTLLNYIQESNPSSIKFNFEEIVSDTLEGSLNLFEAMLLKEAAQCNISLDISIDNISEKVFDLRSALSDLIEELYKKNKKTVIVTIDNYDTPLLASYYYHYYEHMKYFFSLFFSNSHYSHCCFIMTGFSRYPSLLARSAIIAYYFNAQHFYYESKKISPLGDLWIPELIRKNNDLVSELHKNSYAHATIHWHELDLDKITTDHNEFLKFLLYLGYFISAKKVESQNYTYELTPHPLLLEIIKEPSLEKKSIHFPKKKTFSILI